MSPASAASDLKTTLRLGGPDLLVAQNVRVPLYGYNPRTCAVEVVETRIIPYVVSDRAGAFLGCFARDGRRVYNHDFGAVRLGPPAAHPPPLAPRALVRRASKASMLCAFDDE